MRSTLSPTPDGARTHADLRAAFTDVDFGEHLAHFHRSTESKFRVAAAFVADALGRNRRCLYVTHVADASAVLGALEEAGIDTETRREAGDLEVLPASEVYPDDEFDPEDAIETLAGACRDAVDDGYDGLAAVGENSWCLRTETSFDSVVEYEAAFDARAPELPATTLCQYDLTRFDETVLARALWVHEKVVYRDTVCSNPYYVDPARYRSSMDSAINARLMLEQTYQLAANRREIERHQQRLSVVNRILRHDIRNDLNLVLGNLDRLREVVDDEVAARDLLDAVDRVTTRLIDRAEKARYVQRTLADAGVETVDLRRTVVRAVATLRDRYPGVRVSADVDGVGAVLADRHLRTALVELLTNAVVHQSGEEESVSITASRDGETVTVEVSNPGPPIPAGDRRALLQDVETELEHANGLGLWLVKWVVDNSRGTLRFPDGEGETCRIAVDLRAVGG